MTSVIDVATIRRDFPILTQPVNGHPLAYLDNAASSQRPLQVLDAIRHYYTHDHANVHRGVHTLSHRATDLYEDARETVRGFINAASVREIVFTRGTTEAINLVAFSFGERVKPGDEILVTTMEHHSNIVPWQLLCERSGAVLRVAPINDAGELLLDEFVQLLGPRTKLVAVTHVSNALGTVNPVKAITAAAHARNIPVILDGAQAVPHQAVDVRELDCDFYAFSGHKMCGPTGTGVLYGREAMLQELPPWQGGGDMILTVSFSGTTYNELPYRLEAGTPNIAGAVGLAAAIRYLTSVGMANIAAWEGQLLAYATAALTPIPGLKLVGTAREKTGLVSFNVDGIHPHDLGTILDQQGVAIRAGHHCAMPVMERFGLAGTARASFAFYNTTAEIDQLVDAVGVCPADVRVMPVPTQDLQNLYRQIVLDHSRHPRNQGRVDHHDREAEGHNPLCGDKVRVYARLRDDTLEDVAFEATGCAICVASASLMTAATKGSTGPAVRSLARQFDRALAGGSGDLPGDLAALTGVSQYPSRIRCATLPWKTLLAALDASPITVTTEPASHSR